MKLDFHSEEFVEAYLENKLSISEKTLFESEMAKDPLLQNEVSLQKDIINSLKEHRKAQLKQRLNNIEVSSGASYAGLKAAASVLLTALIGAGAYIVFFNNNTVSDQNTNTAPSTQEQVIAKQNNGNTTASLNEGPTDNQNNTIVFDNKNVTNSADKNNQLINSKNTSANQESKQVADNILEEEKGNVTMKRRVITPPAFSNLNIKENFDEQEITKSDANGVLPQEEISKNANQSVDKVEIKVINKSKKDLSYQFYSSKLFLYGDFNSVPYEIVEFNSAKSHSIYLYYQGDYYELKQNQTKITPLKVVNDKDLIKQLNHLNSR